MTGQIHIDAAGYRWFLYHLLHPEVKGLKDVLTDDTERKNEVHGDGADQHAWIDVDELLWKY